jgi:3',5'-cyclic AMP phosphodiesterase CpdA
MKKDSLFLVLILSIGCLSQPGEEVPPAITDATVFMVYGDSRDNPHVHRKLVEEMRRHDFDIVLHTGDFVNRGDATDEWEEVREITRGMVLYPTVGNHDYPLENYFLTFNVSTYYSFDYGYVHVVSLNVFENYTRGSPQYRWLERDLNNSNAPWKVIFFHVPPYSSGEHGPDLDIQDTLVPLFEEYGVEIVFSGHDHDYERSHPLLRSEISNKGVVYFVSGGGGAKLYDVGSNWWTAERRKAHHFIKVEINQTSAYFTVIDVNGRIFDSFWLEN